MGYLKDLGTGTVTGVCPNTGYPKGDWGHLLDPVDPRTGELVPDWDKPGTELYNLTSPYGHLWFAVGNGDDFWCFDYAVLDRCPDGKTRMVLDATINSETGSYIGGADYRVMLPELGGQRPTLAALDMVRAAEDWLAEPIQDMWSGKLRSLRHNKSGWNQDPLYFVRCVAITEAEILGIPVPDFSDRQKRLGGKRIQKFVEKIQRVA